MPAEFDLFLSHNSEDKPAVREIADGLKRRHFKPWLDVENLTPGRLWQDEAEEVIRTCRSAAVFVGPSGIGPWERHEMRALLSQAVKRNIPVIPVLLPGASAMPELPLFLGERTWVDLRNGITPEGLDSIIHGITGQRPKRKQSKPQPPPPDSLALPLPAPSLGDLLKRRDEELQHLTRSLGMTVLITQVGLLGREWTVVARWVSVLLLLLILLRVGLRLRVFFRHSRQPTSGEDSEIIEVRLGNLKEALKAVVADALQAGPSSKPAASNRRVETTLYREHGNAYLQVKNHGPGASYWAQLQLAEGKLENWPQHEVFARWDHTSKSKALIPRGAVHRLRLGRLEKDGPICRWHVPYSSDDQAGEAPAWLSWCYGRSYEQTASGSAVTIALALFADPENPDAPVLHQVKFKGDEVTEV